MSGQCPDRIEVRVPDLAEMPAVARLRFTVLDEPLGLPFDPIIGKLEDAAPTTIHVAAFAWDEPVSTLRLEMHDQFGPYVRRMATRYDHHGHGHGRQLIERIAAVASELGMSALTLHARPGSELFYQRCGFIALPDNAKQDVLGRYPKMIRQL